MDFSAPNCRHRLGGAANLSGDRASCHALQHRSNNFSGNVTALLITVASNRRAKGDVMAPLSLPAVPVSLRDAPPVSDSGSIDIILRVPKPAHNLTTSPELLRRRQEQRAAARELTRRLADCDSISEAKALYEAYGERFNGIHFATLFTSLARLWSRDRSKPNEGCPPGRLVHLQNPRPATQVGPGATPSSPSGSETHRLHRLTQRPLRQAATAAPAVQSTSLRPSHVLHPPPVHHNGCAGGHAGGSCAAPSSPTIPSIPAAAVAATAAAHSRSQRAELRHFVSERLLPHLGLCLMGLGPRQLAAVLTALAQLKCLPQGFWLSEWLQHFVRRLQPPPPPAAARARPGGHGTNVEWGVGSEPLSAPVAAPAAGASVDETTAVCTPTDIARAMWALAQLRMQHCRAASSIVYGAAAPPSLAATKAEAADAATAWALQIRGGLFAAGAGYQGPSAAQHEDFSGPSLVWLQTVSYAFASQAAVVSAAEMSSYLWAAARLGYRPPKAVMAAMMARCAQLLGDGEDGGGTVAVGAAAAASGGSSSSCCLGPRELSVVLWALAVLGFSPGKAWLHLAGAKLAHWAGPEAAGVTWARQSESCSAAELRGRLSDTTADGKTVVAAGVPLGAAVARAAAAGDGCGSHGSMTPLTISEDPLAADDVDWWTGHLSHTPLRAVAAAATAGGGVQLSARQAATCAWAFTRLGHQPPDRVLTALLLSTCVTPAAPAKVAAAAAAAARPLPQDLSMLVFALGVMRFQPQADQALAMVGAMAARLPDASPQDLVVWAGALARMRLAVPDPWFGVYLRRAAPELAALPPLALVNWVDAVARMWTARPPRRSRMELELLRRWSGSGGGGGGKGEGGEKGEEEGGSSFREPWIVVALPKAKPPRQAPAVGVFSPLPPPQRRHQHGHVPCGRQTANTQSPSHLFAQPPSTDSAPLAGPKAPTAAEPPRRAPKLGSVFIRPADRHLHRQRLLPRLLRLTAARLPHLDLEQHCRLAWAVAHLHVAVQRSWVDELIAQTTAALERRLHHQQQQGGVRQELLLTPSLPPQPQPASQSPVVDARWLLKLVRAVEMLLRGPRRGGGGGCRRLVLHHRLRRLGSGHSDASPLLSDTKAVGMAAAGPPPSSLVAWGYIPRRWRQLLMVAMLPQLPSLTNAQLLRFVRTLARLRAAGGVASADAMFASESDGNGTAVASVAAGEFSGGGPSSTAAAAAAAVVGLGRRGPRRRLAAQFGAYCRRRVEATCDGQEACDLMTRELLRWTWAWERVESGGGGGGGGGGDDQGDGGAAEGRGAAAHSGKRGCGQRYRGCGRRWAAAAARRAGRAGTDGTGTGEGHGGGARAADSASGNDVARPAGVRERARNGVVNTWSLGIGKERRPESGVHGRRNMRGGERWRGS